MGQQRIAGDVAQASEARQLLLLTAEGGERNVLDDFAVISDLADGAGVCRRVIQAVLALNAVGSASYGREFCDRRSYRSPPD